MSSGLYSGTSGLALGTGLYRSVSGLWSGASGLVAGFGTSYSPEATAYFAAMSVQPSDARKDIINTCINAIVAAGVWAKLDWLSLMAAHDAQAARLNAINPAQAMTAVNAPTFTTDRGYTGDGATNYLNTGWNPLTASSPEFAQNNAAMGVWCGTDSSSFSQCDIGHYTRAMIVSRNGTNINFYPNSSGGLTGALPSSTSVGHSAWSKTGSATSVVYKNGASIGTPAVATAAPFNQPFTVCAGMGSTGTVTGYSPRRIQAVHWGSQLSGAETLALYNALATYMTAVGA